MGDRPKRPMTAYFLWLNSVRESISAEHPGLKVTEIAIKGGEMWRSMNVKDKKVWEERASKAREQYGRDLESYNNSYNANDGDGPADRPKRPMTAYLLWLNSARESIKAGHPGIKVTEIAKMGGEIWGSMKEKEKSIWEKKAAIARQQYAKDLEYYNANIASR